MFYFLAIFFLGLFDIVATHYQIVVYGSFSIEANPLMRWVMETYGILAAYGFRMATPLIAVPLLLFFEKDKRAVIWVLRGFLLLHVALVGWHFHVTDFFTIHIG